MREFLIGWFGTSKDENLVVLAQMLLLKPFYKTMDECVYLLFG